MLPARQLPLAAATLIEQKWVVTADRQAIRGPGATRLSVASGVDWFEVHGGIRYQTEQGEEEISLPQILAAARSGKQMIQLGDGSSALLPEQWLAEHGLLAAIGKVEEDHLVFKNSQAALLDALLENQPNLQVDEVFAKARQRLKQFDGIEPVSESATFHGELRPYQQQGLGWMRFLRWFGMGGVLADDMGLGKTIQVLSMLEARYTAPDDADDIDKVTDHRPTLIVVPRSVVFNWMDEAAKFAPHLRVQAYTGQDRDALRKAFDDHDIVITSYGLMRRDITELQDHAFEYVVLDEAQAIKNPDSQSAKSARLINARYRLALTGTPVENHLGDLWSIFEFLNPGMLGSNTRFAQLVRGGLSNAAEANGDMEGDSETDPTASRALWTGRGATTRSPEAALQVAQALRPFILRRTKKQVLDDLPEKTEQTILCEMEPAQRQVYDELLKHYRTTLLGNAQAAAGGASTGGNTSPMMVLEALLRLRQASCHPGLIDPTKTSEPSAKLDTLVEMLVELIDEGHKALIFSQFTSMLAIVRTRLEELGITHEYLDGQTRDRKRHVERFQNDPACPVFLISLKAGGLGLNLTAAEYVFILDPWWNPAVEAQAIDRAHRIGQTQHVFAYRLICEDTVEQRIAELQEKKKLLADAIIGGEGNLLSNLTKDDLAMLLS
jgi:SNF2 family DNA or RNA helicase